MDGGDSRVHADRVGGFNRISNSSVVHATHSRRVSRDGPWVFGCARESV